MAIANPTRLTTVIATTSGLTTTTGTLSPAANALLVVVWSGNNVTTGANAVPLSIDNAFGLTWTKVERSGSGGGRAEIALFYAVTGASPGSDTITVTASNNVSNRVLTVAQVTADGALSVVQSQTSNSLSTTTHTLTLASAPGAANLIIGAICTRSATSGQFIGVDAAYTTLHEEVIGSVHWQQVDYDNGGADSTIDWSMTNFSGNGSPALAIEVTEAASGIEGSASITLADASVAATSTLQIAGSSSVTLGDSTLSATGTLTIAGSAALTLDDAISTATGTVAISGASSIALESATATAAGTLALSGTLTATLANATATATGAVQIAGAASLTLDDATLEGSGVIGDVPLVGTLAVTLDDATAAASGALTLAGTFSTTLANATGSATATLSIGASATITLADATLIATATNEGVVAYVTYTMQVEVLTITTAQVEVF